MWYGTTIVETSEDMLGKKLIFNKSNQKYN